MVRPAVIALAILASWPSWAGLALAQDATHIQKYHSDPQVGKWLRSLKRPDEPGKNYTCCNLQDCSPTEADWRDGQWYATWRGRQIPIPESKVVKDSTSIDGEAWLCAAVEGPLQIFCFVPPDQSY